MTFKRYALTFAIALLGFALPSVSFAASLTAPQVNAIIGLLQAFSVDQAVIARVETLLGAVPVSASGDTTVSDPPISVLPAAAPHLPPVGSLYPTSAIGYDLSFNTTAYPTIPFGYGVVGTTGGKAFVHNARLASEYSWARLASAAAPTFYMNLNAPYGSTVAGHIGTPKDCPADTITSTQTASSTSPTACEGYNYGYNAAADAYAQAVSSATYNKPLFLWLDIEEANSWSPDSSVNDATIQGAIDYLNAQGVRAGIYSVPRMWSDIAGSNFTPAQTIGGQAVAVPTWFPIGITSQVGATNACATQPSFIPGSPVWIIQYEANSTAIDQNYAC